MKAPMKRPKMKELKEQAKKLLAESESEGWKENTISFLKSVGGLE